MIPVEYYCCMNVRLNDRIEYPHDSDRRRTTATGPAEPGFSSMAMGSGRGESYPMGLSTTQYSIIHSSMCHYNNL